MTTSTLILAAALGLAARHEVIDGFDYPTDEAAQAAWQASEGAPPVRMVADGDRPVLQLRAPFAENREIFRVYVDRRADLDLAAPGAFELEIFVDEPAIARGVNLYFRSRRGWYSASQGLAKNGWQTLRFSKASYGVEDAPAGWDQIDGIRIAVWRGANQDGLIRLGKLTAVSHDVALVIPEATSEKEYPELRGALGSAELVGGMLAELGLGSDAIDEKALLRGALGKRKIVILAHNPGISDEAIAALERFVGGGGKLFVCYTLRGRLGEILGVGNPKYVHPDRDTLAEIRFDADLPGLPASVRQASWNITAAEPAGHNCRVIGRWFDENGKPTGYPAMLLSDRGAFFSHTVLGDDRQGKEQMLAAVLGHLAPALWQEMAEAAIDRASKVGHCQSQEALAEHVKKYGTPEALERLTEGSAAYREARQAIESGEHITARQEAQAAHEAFVAAYLIAQPSPTREGRAWWNHSGTGAYDGDWDRTCRELAANGFNMVIPNMLWAGRAHYASDVLPRSRTFDQHGDQIAQCVAAAKKHGIEVHVWKVNYNLSGAPREFADKLRREGRTQVSPGGEPIDWLCPSHPDNLKLELDSLLEVARNYDVDGLHFDYIRYPGSQGCYCDGCRQRFQEQTGARVENWPGDCYSRPLKDKYRDWRCEQINHLVEAVSREARKIKPGIKISAAVFGAYPSCRESVGQDWPVWVRNGWLDFICPMDYTQSDLAFTHLVSSQLKLVGGRIPVYPGIGATASRSTLSPDRVVGQIYHARRLGAAGFTIFNLTRSTAESILPGVGQRATKAKAVPPHREK